MKIAICGKGGVGKSMISGTLARHLGLRGHQVVAVDADPNPNLGVSLGVDRHVVEHMRPILNALLDAGHTHDDPVPSPDDLLARFGVDGPDGIRLVATGKIERPSGNCLCCGSHTTTRRFFGDIPDAGRIVVADLEAGLGDLVWANPGPADTVLVVTDGSAKALEIARRACRLAEELGVQQIIGVANRATGAADAEARRTATLLGTEVMAVPEDIAVGAADDAGVAPIDTDPSSPAMAAVALIADRLTNQPDVRPVTAP